MNKPRISLILPLAAACLWATACKKDDASKDSPASGAKASGAEATAGGAKAAGGEAKAGPQAIAALKLQFDGPAGAKVSEMAGSQMVQAPGLVFTVDTASEMTSKTLDAAIEDSKMYDGAITRQDKLADGYHLEFNNKGGMGANFFVQVYREIGGTGYLCSTTAPDAGMAASAAKACLSLRPL